MRIFIIALLSLLFSATVSLAAGNCPQGFSEVVSQYPKNRPHTHVEHLNSQRQNHYVCWGVFAYRDSIACYHYMERPCVSAEAAAVCNKDRDESRRVNCLALSANKEYDDNELEECRAIIWGNRAECMEERGRPLD